MVYSSVWFILLLALLTAGAIICIVFLFKVRRDQKKRNRALAFSMAAMLLLLALDRATKIVFAAELTGRGVVTLIPKVLGLYLLENGNTGGAWGILSNATWVLSAVTALAMIAAIYLLFARRLYSSWIHTALLLVTVGGLGNLYDRIIYGSVTDFLRFLFIDFPIFNVADCCVTVGGIIALLAVLFGPKDDPWFADRPRKAVEGAAKAGIQDSDTLKDSNGD